MPFCYCQETTNFSLLQRILAKYSIGRRYKGYSTPPPEIVGGPGPQSSPLPHLPVIATLYKLFYLSFMDANIIQSVSNNVYLLISFLISSELPFFDATTCCQMITRSNRVISQLYFKTSCKENFSSP